MAKLSKKAIEAKVDKIASKAVVGYVIPMMSVPKVFEAGVVAASSGASDEEIFVAVQSAAAAVAVS